MSNSMNFNTIISLIYKPFNSWNQFKITTCNGERFIIPYLLSLKKRVSDCQAIFSPSSADLFTDGGLRDKAFATSVPLYSTPQLRLDSVLSSEYRTQLFVVEPLDTPRFFIFRRVCHGLSFSPLIKPQDLHLNNLRHSLSEKINSLRSSIPGL